jgi:NitT/TauT family transport system permease protein
VGERPDSEGLQTSGYRLGMGLLIAIAIGVPIGILMGRNRRFRELRTRPSS